MDAGARRGTGVVSKADRSGLMRAVGGMECRDDGRRSSDGMGQAAWE